MNFRDSYDDSDDHDDYYYGDVHFYRPDGDTEGKSRHWCDTNGFFQVEEGLWSGDWYYKHFPEKLIEKKQRTCPVQGCGKEFRTSDHTEKHVRTSIGKAHCTYRKEHGIKRGPTPEEEEEERAAKKRREEKRIAAERSELYEILNESMMDPESFGYQAQRARERLQELDERDNEILCPVNQCKRRFETKDDLRMHLVLSKGKAHQRELEEFEPESVQVNDNPSQKLMAQIDHHPSQKIMAQVDDPSQKLITDFFSGK